MTRKLASQTLSRSQKDVRSESHGWREEECRQATPDQRSKVVDGPWVTRRGRWDKLFNGGGKLLRQIP